MHNPSSFVDLSQILVIYFQPVFSFTRISLYVILNYGSKCTRRSDMLEKLAKFLRSQVASVEGLRYHACQARLENVKSCLYFKYPKGISFDPSSCTRHTQNTFMLQPECQNLQQVDKKPLHNVINRTIVHISLNRKKE